MNSGQASQHNREQIEDVVESFLERFRSGDEPRLEDYLTRHPQLAEELRELIPALLLLEKHAVRDGAEPIGCGTDTLPTHIGDFTIIREIGRGGMGVVYEAVQESLGRHVALKVLAATRLSSPANLERFLLEARAAAGLHHTNIVPVFGVGQHDGLHYYAMQFIRGQSLDQVIDKLRQLRDQSVDHLRPPNSNELTNGRHHLRRSVASKSELLSIEIPTNHAENSVAFDAAKTELTSSHGRRAYYRNVARLGLQVCDALAYAHAAGILHRDIKPSNLLLDSLGDVWITDFGLAKAEGADGLTQEGDFVGTLRYMSPERLEGWSDQRSDVYGLGATLYELLALRPFCAATGTAKLIDEIAHGQPPPPRKFDKAIPVDLETIVLKATARDPAARYPSAEEMANDLRRFLSDRSILARRSTLREQLIRWCRRNPLVAALSAVLLFLMTSVALISPLVALRQATLRRQTAESLQGQIELTDRLAGSLAGHDHLHHGWEAYSDGRLDDAWRDFEEGVKVFQELADAGADQKGHYRGYLADTYFHLQTIIATQGQMDEAESTAERALALYEVLDDEGRLRARQRRNMIGVMDGLAILRLHRGDVVGFRQLRQELVRRFADEEDLEMSYALAWGCSLAAGEASEFAVALEHARAATEEQPNTPQFASVLGILYCRAGQLDEAVAQLHKAQNDYATYQPDHSTVIFTQLYRAFAEARLGHLEEARSCLVAADARYQANVSRIVWNDALTVDLLRTEIAGLLDQIQ